MLIEANDRDLVPARLKVIGIGGCGSNAVGRMIEEGLTGLEFLVVNTDLQALHVSPCSGRLQIGAVETRGLGTGGNPERGRKAAEEDEKTLEEHMLGVDMLFITAGMGGGTGTGAAPIAAHIAKSLDVLTVAIVTTPFMLEGRPRRKIADEGIEALRREVDTLIVVPNEKLLEVLDPSTPMQEAYRAADEVLYQATRGISELITIAGVMNRDFADVRSVMKRRGNALMGIGVASGENRARDAASAAISNRLLEDTSIHGAEAVLVNVAGGAQLGLGELSQAVGLIQEAAGEDAHIYLGNVIDPSLGDEVRVTVVATGFGRNGAAEDAPGNGSKPEAASQPAGGESAPPESRGSEPDPLLEEALAAAAGEPAGPSPAAETVSAPAPRAPVGSPEEPVVRRSFQGDASAHGAVRPESLPLWSLNQDVTGGRQAQDTGLRVRETSQLLEEREPVLPLPVTMASKPEGDWVRRIRRRTMDIPAFRRRIAR
jgi:cell division protein FtsZ